MERIDLNAAPPDLRTLPRFQRASVHLNRLVQLAATAGIGGLACWLMAPGATSALYGTIWTPVLTACGTALLVLAAGALSAYLSDAWRMSAMGTRTRLSVDWLAAEPVEPAVPEPPAPDKPSDATAESSGGPAWTRVSASVPTLLRRIGVEGAQAGSVELVTALALLVSFGRWDLAGAGTALGNVGTVAAATVVLTAFGLLALERYLNSYEPTEWPEALDLRQLTRVAIATLLVCAVALFASSDARTWPVKLAVLSGVLPAAVAAELLLRAFFSVFTPKQIHVEPRGLTSSALAGLLRWPLHPLRALQHELRNRYGIDLRQNWALAFVRRAFVPLLATLVGVAWLTTGLTEIPLDGRGIYERFGRPVAVLQPGLHAMLPWPFGRVRPVDNGIVHEVATVVSEGEAPVDAGGAEGPPPDSANRLWDQAHDTEVAQVIASAAGQRQSFQIVNVDLRVLYRIGQSDQAAIAATYNTSDLPGLVRSTANHVLLHDFAARTLDGVLAEQRAHLATEIAARTRDELDRLGSGVEVLGAVIEAIHPPAGAANAYHSVQAAQINAQALIARRRGSAAEQRNSAQESATTMLDQATAAARETTGIAEAERLRFVAEQQAYRAAGRVFLLEQYFDRLGAGLSKATLVLIDHRIHGAAAPTIDLRSFAPTADITPLQEEQR